VQRGAGRAGGTREGRTGELDRWMQRNLALRL
jgi:ribosomal protein L19E